MGSFNFTTSEIFTWKSTGIFNRFSNSSYITSSNMMLLEMLKETYLI